MPERQGVLERFAAMFAACGPLAAAGAMEEPPVAPDGETEATKAVKPACAEDEMPIIQCLRAAEASRPYCDGSPIYSALTKEKPYESDCLRLRMVVPHEFETLFMRLTQKDVAKGCIDPDMIGVLRDFAEVSVRVSENESSWRELRLPAFMAHLANPMCLVDEEAEDGCSPLFQDGSWTGTLIWDSTVHVSQLILGSDKWRARLCGRSTVELGCGLGLPGMVSESGGCGVGLG